MSEPIRNIHAEWLAKFPTDAIITGYTFGGDSAKFYWDDKMVMKVVYHHMTFYPMQIGDSFGSVYDLRFGRMNEYGSYDVLSICGGNLAKDGNNCYIFCGLHEDMTIDQPLYGGKGLHFYLSPVKTIWIRTHHKMEKEVVEKTFGLVRLQPIEENPMNKGIGYHGVICSDRIDIVKDIKPDWVENVKMATPIFPA